MSDAADIAETLAAAHDAIATGQLSLAATHIAAALSKDPFDETALAMLEALADCAPSPLSLVAMEGDVDYARAAVHAYVLQHRGDIGIALPLLVQVAQARPDVPFMGWVPRWLRKSGVLQQIDDQAVDAIAAHTASLLRSESQVPLPPEHYATFEGLLELVNQLRELSSKRRKLALLVSSILRRLQQHQSARRVARETYRVDPSGGAAVLVALASRQLGEFGEAVQWLRTALGHEPDDDAIRLDLADTLVDDGSFQAAADIYAVVLENAPNHSWAEPARMYALWLNGDDEQHAQLTDLAERSEAAASILRRVDEEPYRRDLPVPADPAAAAVKDAIEHMHMQPRRGGSSDNPGTLHMTAEHPEAPSITLALALAMSVLREHTRIVVDNAATPSPHPTHPKLFPHVCYGLGESCFRKSTTNPKNQFLG